MLTRDMMYKRLPHLAVEGSQADAWKTVFILVAVAVGILLIGLGVEGLLK